MSSLMPPLANSTEASEERRRPISVRGSLDRPSRLMSCAAMPLAPGSSATHALARM